MQNPLDGATKDEIMQCIKTVCTTFTVQYVKAYVLALIKVKEEEARAKPSPYKLLERPEDVSDLKTGWLTKEGGMFKSWKKRWFVVRHDYAVDYFASEADANKPKPKPKGTMGLCGYHVVADPNDGIIKRLTDLATKMGMDISELPKPKQYPELTLEVHHYRRRCWFIQAANADEKKEWVDMFQTCCRWAYGLRDKEEVHKRAFHEAVRRTRWELGRWGWWSYGGNEEQILSDLISAELEWAVMGRIYGKITGPWVIRNKVRNQVLKTIDTFVSAGVSPAWKAMEAAVKEVRPKIEPTLAQVAEPLGQLKGEILDKMKNAALSIINPMLDEHVSPHLSKILEVIKSPFTECFDECFTMYDGQIEEFKKDHSSLADYKKGFKRLDYFPRSWNMWTATRKLDVMYDPLWLLNVIFTEIRPWSLIWNAHDDIKHKMDNAIYTFEQEIETAMTSEGDKLKSDAAYAAQVIDMAKAKTLETYKADAIIATNEFYCKIMKAIVMPPFNALVIPACKAILEPLNDMIPEPMKQFVDILEMFDELINGIIDGAIERVVSSV
jgi:hypothetical protein